MSIKSWLSKPFSKFVVHQQIKWMHQAGDTQTKWFEYLLKKASNTAFAKDHRFSEIKSIADFQRQVPIRDYEDFIPYMDKIKKGASNILWPGKPLYLAKTSGTTSGVKYIPISKESIPFHIQAARDALLNYIYQTGNSSPNEVAHPFNL